MAFVFGDELLSKKIHNLTSRELINFYFSDRVLHCTMKEHNTTYNYYTEYTTIAHIGNRKVICSYCKHVLFVDMRAKWEEYLQNRTIC